MLDWLSLHSQLLHTVRRSLAAGRFILRGLHTATHAVLHPVPPCSGGLPLATCVCYVQSDVLH